MCQFNGVFSDLVDLLRHHHFRNRHSVEDWSNIPFIVEGNVIKNKTLSIVEANVKLPVLPLKLAPRYLEGYTFGLSDVDRLEVIPVASLVLNSEMMIVQWGRLD